MGRGTRRRTPRRRRPRPCGGLGDGGNPACEGLDDPVCGLRGADVLTDRDEPGVTGRGHGVAAEPVDGDAVQAAGVGHHQTVPEEPYLDGEPGGPVVEVAVDQRISDQLAEGDEGIAGAVVDRTVRLGDNRGVEGAPGPQQRRVKHPRDRPADGHLVAGPRGGGVRGKGRCGRLDHVSGEPLLGVGPKGEETRDSELSAVDRHSAAAQELGVIGKSTESGRVTFTDGVEECVDEWRYAVPVALTRQGLADRSHSCTRATTTATPSTSVVSPPATRRWLIISVTSFGTAQM